MNKQQTIVWKTLQSGTTKEIPLIQYIVAKQNELREIAGRFRKEDKVTKAYREQEQAYLDYFQDNIRNWVMDAYSEDQDIVSKTMHMHNIIENFDVVVLVSKKKES